MITLGYTYYSTLWVKHIQRTIPVVKQTIYFIVTWLMSFDDLWK